MRMCSGAQDCSLLTVIIEPVMKVDKAFVPSTLSFARKNRFITPGHSPATIKRGSRAIALYKFVYHERCNALPLTTSKLFLMTTECIAVIIELTTPKLIPIIETEVPSRKTPMKKPSVTNAQAIRTRSDGRACRTTQDVTTVKGSTIPRATW